MLARDIIPRKIESVFDRFDPFFSGDFLPRVAWPRKLDITAEWRPSADVIENKDEYLVKCELPEVKREDVKLDLADGMLRIRGERKLEIDEKKDKVHRVESFYGTFMRTFELPENVDVAKIRADMHEGVLLVHLPKMEAKMTKPIGLCWRASACMKICKCLKNMVPLFWMHMDECGRMSFIRTQFVPRKYRGQSHAPRMQNRRKRRQQRASQET